MKPAIVIGIKSKPSGPPPPPSGMKDIPGMMGMDKPDDAPEGDDEAQEHDDSKSAVEMIDKITADLAHLRTLLEPEEEQGEGQPDDENSESDDSYGPQ